MQPIRLLKPCRTADAELISARVIDELFASYLAPDIQIQSVLLVPWFDEILGLGSNLGLGSTLLQAAKNFLAATANFDFLYPSYECIALAPLFLALRNLAQAKIRLLLFAHSPGIYVMEWALLRPLLVPGDLIIAPSAKGKDTIEFLCPELTKFVRVIPYPIASLPQVASGETERIISLGRITPSKLVHRQIEAMEVLRSRGHRLPKLQIAGPLTNRESAELTPYARCLAAKIHRLGLQDCVQLIGPIYGDRDKARFITGARLLLNLSVTVEESFGIAIVEALGLGVPAVTTHWDGFPETLGAGGELVPVVDVGPGLAVDVKAEQVADAIERMLASPPTPEVCCEQARQFCPARVRPKYCAALKEAMELADRRESLPDPFEVQTLSAAPTSGLLSLTAPLPSFSWKELFAFHLEDCDRIRQRWAGGVVFGSSCGERLSVLVLAGRRKPLERFLGELDFAAYTAATGLVTKQSDGSGDFSSRIALAVFSRATFASRLTCLIACRNADRPEVLHQELEQLKQEGLVTAEIDFLAVEFERQSGNFAKAFQLCTAETDLRGWNEFAALRLRQLARICREWGQPELALPWLRRWLEQFPDSLDSGPVWLDNCVNALEAGRHCLTEAQVALRQARSLLGDSPMLDKVEKNLFEVTFWIQDRFG